MATTKEMNIFPQQQHTAIYFPTLVFHMTRKFETTRVVLQQANKFNIHNQQFTSRQRAWKAYYNDRPTIPKKHLEQIQDFTGSCCNSCNFMSHDPDKIFDHAVHYQHSKFFNKNWEIVPDVLHTQSGTQADLREKNRHHLFSGRLATLSRQDTVPVFRKPVALIRKTYQFNERNFTIIFSQKDDFTSKYVKLLRQLETIHTQWGIFSMFTGNPVTGALDQLEERLRGLGSEGLLGAQSFISSKFETVKDFCVAFREMTQKILRSAGVVANIAILLNNPNDYVAKCAIVGLSSGVLDLGIDLAGFYFGLHSQSKTEFSWIPTAVAFILVALLGATKISALNGLKIFTTAKNLGISLAGIGTLHRIFGASWDELFPKIYKACTGNDPAALSIYSQLDGLEGLVAEVERFDQENLAKDIMVSRMVCEQVMYFYKKMNVYLRQAEEARIRPVVFSAFGHLFRKVAEWKKEVDKSTWTSMGTRIEPVVVKLYGASGVGKSTITALLALEVLKGEIKWDHEGETIHNHIYTRNPGTDFWSGYRGQEVCVFDDFMQLVDSESRPNPEILEVIRAANNAPFLVPMAEITEKANSYFTSKLMVLSTNLDRFNPKSIVCAEALNRRIDLDLEVRKISEPGQGLGTDHLEFLARVDGDTVEKLTFDEVVTILRFKRETKIGMKNRLETEISKRKAAPPINVPLRQTRVSDILVGKPSWGQNVGLNLPQGYVDTRETQHAEKEPPKVKKSERLVAAVLGLCAQSDDQLLMLPLPKYESTPVGAMNLNEEISDVESMDETIEFSKYRLGGEDEAGPFDVHRPEVCDFEVLKNGEVMIYMDNKCILLEQLKDSIFTNMIVPRAFAEEYIMDCEFIESGPNEFFVVKHSEDIARKLAGFIKKTKSMELVNAVGRRLYPRAYINENSKRLFNKDPPWLEALKHVAMSVGVAVGAQMFIMLSVNLVMWGLKKSGLINPVLFTESKDDTPKTAKYRAPVKGVQTEACIDQNIFGILNKVKKNLVSFHSNTLQICQGVFIRGRVAITTKHSIYGLKYINVDGKPVLRESIEVFFSNETAFKRVFLKDLRFVEHPTLDIMAVVFPTYVRQHVDLTKYVARADDLKFLTTQARLVLLNSMEVTIAGTEITTHFGRRSNKIEASATKICEGKIVPDVIEYKEYFKYEGVDNQSGNCGAPLLLVNPQVNNKLAGIHVAGRTGEGYSMILASEIVDKLLDECTTEETLSIDVNYTDDDFICAQGNTIPITKVIPLFEPSKTEIRPSLIHGVTPIVKKPAILRPVGGVDPLIKGLAGFGTTTPALPRNLEREKSILQKYFLTDKTRDSRILSYEEAIFGTEDGIEPLKTDTSAGYPWVKETRLPGKKKWIGTLENRWICPTLISRLDQYKAEMLSGEFAPRIFTSTLKDERREIAKADPSKPENIKTRVFSAAPMDLTIMMKCYYGTFFNALYQNRITNTQTVGINPYSNEWTFLAQYMTQVADEVVDGDYKRFDTTQPSYFMDLVFQVAEDFYVAATQEDRLIRFALSRQVIYATHLARGEIFQCVGKLPSGCYGTTYINSGVNLVAVAFAYFEQFPSHGPLDFMRNVRMVSHGDDNLISITRVLQDEFTPKIIGKHLAKVGMEYTSADKGELMDEYKTLDKVTFLKRGFVNENGRYRSPLELDTCLDMVNWIRKSADSKSATLQVCDAAARELAFTDPSGKWTQQIENALSEVKIRVRLPRYIDMYYEHEKF